MITLVKLGKKDINMQFFGLKIEENLLKKSPDR
jgi:hypothetical protein